MSRNRVIKRNRDNGSTGVIVGLVLGGVLLFVTIVGITLYYTLGKSRKSSSDDDTAAIGNPVEIPNVRVSVPNYQLIQDGWPTKDVEALLGKGRVPTTADFDAIFGKENPGSNYDKFYQQRSTWEENTQRGLVRIWSNGPSHLLVTFTQLRDKAGTVVAKMLKKPDGSALVMYGDGQPELPPPGPNPQPKLRSRK